MTRVEAIRKFFASEEKPLKNSELLQFAKEDKKGFEEIGELCLKHYGETEVKN